MNGFLLKLLANAVKDPDIRAFLFDLAERVGKTLLPGLASVIPAAVAAGIKGLGDLIPDIHMPTIHEVEADIRTGVNALLPNDVDIPFISDAFEKVTGFDLTDIITGRHH
jgi:hypothetical protein